MSGFAVLIQTNLRSQAPENVFHSLAQLTAGYKKLQLPAEQASERCCYAVKLDSPSSLHKGIVRDDLTGSWLLAAGTVVHTAGGSRPDPNLSALLRDYLENGQDALQHYDGHFGLVIYDKRDESLSVISDPLGFFSIFWSSQGEQVFISTSALAIARQIRAKPDELAVECFLRTGQVYGTTTIWQDVKRVLPGTVIKFAAGQVHESEYWAPMVDPAIASLSFADAVDHAVETLSRTVELALRREGKVWQDLTGGFDTRMVATMASKVGIPFIANCVGPTGHPDVTISTEICRKMGWEYKHISMPDDWAHEQCAWFETALHKGDAHLNVLQLAGVMWGNQSKSAAGNVSITGGGGELWRGAYWRQEMFNIGKTPVVDYDRLMDFRMFLSPVALPAMREDRTEQVRSWIKDHLAKVASRYADLPNTTKLDRLLIYKGTAHGGAYLSAAVGFQRCLLPLYFKAPTTFAFSLNYRWKHPIDHRFVRVMLEKENPRLANTLTTSGGPAAPMRLTNLPMFWPFWRSVIRRVVGKYSRQFLGKAIVIGAPPPAPDYPLPDWKKGWLDYADAQGLLRPAEMRSGGFYNGQALQQLVSQAGSDDFKYSDFMGRIITLEMAQRAVETGR